MFNVLENVTFPGLEFVFPVFFESCLIVKKKKKPVFLYDNGQDQEVVGVAIP